MSKSTILAHGDSDGVASAALVFAAQRKKYEDIRVFFTHPVALVDDFKEFARGNVVIVDIAISEPHIDDLIKLFSRYREKVVFIDHHPEPLGIRISDLPVEVVHDTGSSASELVYRFYQSELSVGMDRVALYGAIADYLDNTKWVMETLRKWDKRHIYFEAGVLSQGLEGSRRMHDFKRHIVAHLAKGGRPSQLSELIIRALVQVTNNEELLHWVMKSVKIKGQLAYVIDPPGSLGIAATYAKGLTDRKVGLAAELRENVAVMSLRSGTDQVDLNKLLRELTPLFGGSGGGHPHAAGARIPRTNLGNFLNKLSELIGN
jgi:RecJ-like exonuclease